MDTENRNQVERPAALLALSAVSVVLISGTGSSGVEV